MPLAKLCLLGFVLGVGAYADALTGLSACTSVGQENCVNAVAGGETAIITPQSAPGTLLVYGDLSGGQTVFLNDYAYGTNGNDPAVQALVSQATTTITQFAPYDPLPACGLTTYTSYCYIQNPGGATVVTNGQSPSYVYTTTPVTQTANQYQTTITATLNGNTVYSQSFSESSSSSAVQNAIQQADSILSGDGATFGSPVLASNSTTLTGSQTVDVQTGPPVADGNTSRTTTINFGPQVVLTGLNQTDPFYVNGGQEDIDVTIFTEYDIPQEAITTNTYLTAQTYDITGSLVGTAPEPGSGLLLGVGLGILLVILVRKRSGTNAPCRYPSH